MDAWLGPTFVTKKLTRTFLGTIPNFYRETKSPKFGIGFQTQSPLKHSGFETEQQIGDLKCAQGASMISLNIDS